MRRPKVGKLGEQITVRTHPISPHLPVGENREEEIGDVVRKRSSILRKGRGSCGVIAQDVGQQGLCHPRCFLGCVPTSMLKRMCEDRDKTGIVRRLSGEIGGVLGIKSPGQSMLACSFDEVGRRIERRGTHQAPFAEAAAIDIADAYTSAVYLDNKENDTYFDMSEAQFTKAIRSNSLVRAPHGDEAFDDGSYVLQFDVGNRVRLIAFKRPDSLVDPASVREVWISSEIFYDDLRQWRDGFIAEWESLPKHD